LLKKAGGAEIVYSSNEHSFTLNIVSNDIKPTDNPGYLSVNNKALQYDLADNDAQGKDESSKSEQKNLLIGYMKYKWDNIKNHLKLNVTGLAHNWVVINNKIHLLWYYNMPGNNNPVIKQINLSTLCFGHVLNLNTSCKKDDNPDDDKELLLTIAQTLKQNNFKTDFAARYKELKGK